MEGPPAAGRLLRERETANSLSTASTHKNGKCNPCVRYGMSPMSRVAQISLVPQEGFEPQTHALRMRVYRSKNPVFACSGPHGAQYARHDGRSLWSSVSIPGRCRSVG